MPSSDFTSIPGVLNAVVELQPKSICDIGVGCGKYGLLFREALEVQGRDDAVVNKPLLSSGFRLDGVEVCEAYIGPIQRTIYDRIFIGDINLLCDSLEQYDLFTMIDVIEHMDEEAGLELLRRLRRKARLGVLLVTPIGEYPQGPVFGNPFETHLSTWGPAQWNTLGHTRYMAMPGRKWMAFVEGCEPGHLRWLHPPRLRRRLKLAFLRAFDAVQPGHRDVPLA